MKRKILLGLCIAFMLSITGPEAVVLAKEVCEEACECEEEQMVTPRYNYIQMASIGINPSNDGSSYMLIIKGTSSVTSISGTVTVYKKNFWGNYKEVDSEAVKENASSLERYGNLSSDGAGDYKIEFIGTVYAGSSSEPITIDATNSY